MYFTYYFTCKVKDYTKGLFDPYVRAITLNQGLLWDSSAPLTQSMGKGLLDGEVQGRFTKCFSYERKRTPLYGELLSRDCLKRLLVLKQLCNLMKNYGRKSLGAFF